jgi:hypothetical protein
MLFLAKKIHYAFQYIYIFTSSQILYKNRITMTIRNIFAALAVSFLITLSAQAQTKKKLIEENEQLKAEKVELQKANIQIEREKQALNKENARLNEANQQAQQEIQRLQQNIVDLKEANIRLNNLIMESENNVKSTKAKTGSTGAVATNSKATSSFVADPNDKRPCALKQNKLQTNQSYFLSLNKLTTKGWGIQVYSYESLCSAIEKAQEFSKSYKMYNTYIRAKEVNGKVMYSVIYGSLKDESSARFYCDNFKKIAKDAEGKAAFVIQH